MGLFNIDIEKYYAEEASNNALVLGIFCIQYPMYCIHARISDTTIDPLDSMDRLIMQLISRKPDVKPLQIAAIVGGSKSLIEYRIETLVVDGLIEHKSTSYFITDLGSALLNNSDSVRKHQRIYDFYLDGLTLQPLPACFYKYYRHKFISENDSYFRTNKLGEELLIRPFGPDLVHTPPNKEFITNNILSFENSLREDFEIPVGLEGIEDISFTKLSLQLLVSVTKNQTGLTKKLLDPFAVYSNSDPQPYLQCLQNNVKIFEEQLRDKISNLEFKLVVPNTKSDELERRQPRLSSNWSEINSDKYVSSGNKCYSFAQDDILEAIKNIYDLEHLSSECLISTDDDLQIKVSKNILLQSSNKGKLVSALIRKRDYKFGNVDHNVFLLFIHYQTDDPYVLEAIRFRELIDTARTSVEFGERWLYSYQSEFTVSIRELLISTGELDILERIDINKHMIQLH